MSLKVTARREDIDGTTTHYKLSDDMIYTREEAVRMWRHGLLSGYHLYKRDGIEDLRDNPHTRENDTIDHQLLIKSFP